MIKIQGQTQAETAERNIQNAADDAARDAIASCQTEATLTAAGQTFREDGTNGCYEGNTWTWSLPTHGNLLINDAVVFSPMFLLPLTSSLVSVSTTPAPPRLIPVVFKRLVPSFLIDNHILWGATAIMIHEFVLLFKQMVNS